MAGIIATVFRHGFRHDLMRVRIDGQMQFPPRATLCFAMFTHFPFAFAENFQSSAVNNHVDRAGLFPNIQQYTHFRCPLGQRRIIRDINAYFHQCGQRFSQSLGLAIRQLKKLSQNEQALYRRIAVHKRVPNLGLGVFVMPFFNRFLAKPEGNRASLNERLVIFPPICYFIRAFPFSGHVKLLYVVSVVKRFCLFYALYA